MTGNYKVNSAITVKYIEGNLHVQLIFTIYYCISFNKHFF